MMNCFQNIKKNLSEATSMSLDLIFRKYPSFVYGNKISATEIPVFLFHTENPEILESKFQFLTKNQYKTLTTEEYYEIITKKKRPGPKSILITIDDGDVGLWKTTYPLLKKYNLRATTFIIPGLMDNNNYLINWGQANIMYKEGIIDFQSHTYSHKLIPVSPKLVGFINSYLILKYTPYELSQHNDIKSGMPLYKSNSRMGKNKKYIIDKELINACANFAGSQKKLKKFYYTYRNSHRLVECYETSEEQKNAILFELSQSKALIEEKISGCKVTHLSLPWNVTSDLTIQLTRELGYKSIFIGKVNNKYYSRDFPDPYNIPRISSDFLFTLPGEGRETLRSILLKKLKRRAKTGASYLTH